MENKLKRYNQWYKDGIISYNTYCQKCQELIDEEMKKINQDTFRRIKKAIKKGDK